MLATFDLVAAALVAGWIVHSSLRSDAAGQGMGIAYAVILLLLVSCLAVPSLLLALNGIWPKFAMLLAIAPLALLLLAALVFH